MYLLTILQICSQTNKSYLSETVFMLNRPDKCLSVCVDILTRIVDDTAK